MKKTQVIRFRVSREDKARLISLLGSRGVTISEFLSLALRVAPEILSKVRPIAVCQEPIQSEMLMSCLLLKLFVEASLCRQGKFLGALLHSF